MEYKLQEAIILMNLVNECNQIAIKYAAQLQDVNEPINGGMR